MTLPLQPGTAGARALYELMTGMRRVDCGSDTDPLESLIALVAHALPAQVDLSEVFIPVDTKRQVRVARTAVQDLPDAAGVAFIERDTQPDAPHRIELSIFRHGATHNSGAPVPGEAINLVIDPLSSNLVMFADVALIDPRWISGRYRPNPETEVRQVLHRGPVNLAFPWRGSWKGRWADIPLEVILAGGPS